jgi:hypothetical protein
MEAILKVLPRGYMYSMWIDGLISLLEQQQQEDRVHHNMGSLLLYYECPISISINWLIILYHPSSQIGPLAKKPDIKAKVGVLRASHNISDSKPRIC